MNNQIMVYKRRIWDYKGSYGVIASGLLMVFLLYNLFKYEELRIFRVNLFTIFLFFSIISFAFALLYSVNKIKKMNCLIENGDLIWANIDWDETKGRSDDIIAHCFIFLKEEGRQYDFYAQYDEPNAGLLYKDKLSQEKYLPVVIERDNPERYVVLLKDLIYSYRVGLLRPLVFSKPIRIIDRITCTTASTE